MKIQLECKVSELAKAVSMIVKGCWVSDVRNLDHIVLNAKVGSLHISAHDMECYLETNIPCVCDIPGEIYVPGKTFNAFLKNYAKCKCEKIEMNVEDDTTELIVLINKQNRAVFNIKSEDYFQFRKENFSNQQINLDCEMFIRKLKDVSFCMSDHNDGRNTESVCIQTSIFDINFIATDRRRLSHSKIDFECIIPEMMYDKQYIIPSHCIRKIETLMKKEKRLSVSVFKNETTELIKFQTENYIIQTRLMDGKFPDYTRIIPKDYNSVFSFNKTEFLNALVSIEHCSKQCSNMVSLKMKEKECFLSCKSIEGQFAETKVSVLKFEGVEITLAFNSEFMKDFLKNVDGTNFTIKTTTPAYPGLFEMVGNSTQYCLMPMTM
jgi:DNA polymerase-3 subunit beta